MADGTRTREFQHMEHRHSIFQLDRPNIDGSVSSYNTGTEALPAHRQRQCNPDALLGPRQFEAPLPQRRFWVRMSILLVAALACGQRGMAQRHPTLDDLFTGKARFEGPGEAEIVKLNFKTPRQLYGQKFAFFDNPAEPNVVYAATRGQLTPGIFNIFLMKSVDGPSRKNPDGTTVLTEDGKTVLEYYAKDGLGFEQVGGKPVFDLPLSILPDGRVDTTKEAWSVYDPHIAVDRSTADATYVMTMECAQLSFKPYWFSNFGPSLCTSTSKTPWIPDSWSKPILVVESVGAHRSASTGVMLIDGPDRYLKSTIVDDGNLANGTRQNYSTAAAATYSAATYLPITTASQSSQSEADVQKPVLRAADISTVVLALGTAPGPGNSITITGRLKAPGSGGTTTSTNVTCTIIGNPPVADKYAGEGQIDPVTCMDYSLKTRHFFTVADRGSYDWKLTMQGTPSATTVSVSWDVTFPDEGIESTSTWAMKINDYSRYQGYSTTAGQLLLGATQNTNCTSSWDCNNIDVQDWQHIGSYYYAIYNGANYFGCSRPPQGAAALTNQWGLAIRRSTSPMGSYDESTGPVILADVNNLCGISYPTLKVINGETFLYYDFYPAADRSEARRSKLIWDPYSAGSTKAPTPATPKYDASFAPTQVVIRPRTAIQLKDSFLAMQGDGNLVMYAGKIGAPGAALWNTGTNLTCKTGDCAAIYSQEGYFLIYQTDQKTGAAVGPAIWDCRVQGNWDALQLKFSAVKPWVSCADSVEFPRNGLALPPGSDLQLTSNADPSLGKFLRMQTDGNLVMYQGTPPNNIGAFIWSSGTNGRCLSGSCEAIFDSTGNLVLYDDGYPYWESGTGGKGLTLRLRTSAPFVTILDGAGTIWPK